MRGRWCQQLRHASVSNSKMKRELMKQTWNSFSFSYRFCISSSTYSLSHFDLHWALYKLQGCLNKHNKIQMFFGVVNQSSHDWKALICLSLEFQFELWFDDHDVLCAPMLVSIWGLQETVIKIFGCQSKPNGLALYSSNHSRVAEKMFFGEREMERIEMHYTSIVQKYW